MGTKAYILNTNQKVQEAGIAAGQQTQSGAPFEQYPRAVIAAADGTSYYTVQLVADDGSVSESLPNIRSYSDIITYEVGDKVHLRYDDPGDIPYIFDTKGGGGSSNIGGFHNTITDSGQFGLFAS